MLSTIYLQNFKATINFKNPLPISLPLKSGNKNPNCFYAPPPLIQPVIAGSFIGDTKQGGLVNFKNVTINPHGNGTHTECCGHIYKKSFVLYACLKQFMFLAQLQTIKPQLQPNGDLVIMPQQINCKNMPTACKALLIRTSPNNALKKNKNYSGTNPPYMHHLAVQKLVNAGIEHLLIDLPSIDKEHDEGKLLAHKAFWQYPSIHRKHCTITELIYVPKTITNGLYLLNLQITNLHLDASPSMPVLYKIIEQ